MRKVLVFGTYDGLHDGHVDFFHLAKTKGDSLHVVVARDATVEKLKGQKPMHSEDDRRSTIANLDIVESVVLGSTGDKYAVIEQIHPDVICLGYDQHSFDKQLADELRKRNLGHIEIERIPAAVVGASLAIEMCFKSICLTLNVPYDDRSHGLIGGYTNLPKNVQQKIESHFDQQKKEKGPGRSYALSW